MGFKLLYDSDNSDKNDDELLFDIYQKLKINFLKEICEFIILMESQRFALDCDMICDNTVKSSVFFNQ